MGKGTIKISAGLFLALAAVSVAAFGEFVSAVELEARRAGGGRIVVIDVRSPAEYERGHIPGAINLPHFGLESKRLPPLGDVAVYDSGLGRILAAPAVEALNRKPGIRAFELAGGLAGWESGGYSTTHVKGLTDTHIPVITYEQLTASEGRGIVLADLRTRKRDFQPLGAGATAPAVTDLNALFPHGRVIDIAEGGTAAATTGDASPASPMRQLAAVDAGQELIVLIDDGDGSAEKTARELRSSGNKRVVVLAGGEEILRHRGRSGTSRVGYSYGDSFRSEGGSGEESGEYPANEGGPVQ